MSRSLIVLPDDSAEPIVKAIDEATRSLRIKMFVFSDTRLVRAVIAAMKRGVKVRAILNAARRNGHRDNEITRRKLEHAGAAVVEGNPAFTVTHEKSMVVDDKLAVIGSLNWVKKNLDETRDYAIVTTRRHDIAEIVDCFEADWYRKPFTPRTRSHLVWCPGPGRDRICRFIDRAQHTLFVQNERFQDAVVNERLVRAVKRGVKVHVMVRPPHTLDRDKLVEGVGGLRILDDVGIRIHKLKTLRLHGKILLADDLSAIVGSINFAPGSLDDRRELAIEVSDPEVVHRLRKVARHDWKHSHPLDLSDEGLRQDLEPRVEGSRELLGL
jgi:phosphatidylserine/phosphatidylglycerophosphate/cardiolipin synthase-like enzyme